MVRKYAAILGITRAPVSHLEQDNNNHHNNRHETIPSGSSIADDFRDGQATLSSSQSSPVISRTVRSTYSWIKLPQVKPTTHGSPFEIDDQVCALLQADRGGDEEDGIDLDPNHKSNPSKAAIWKARSQILLAAVLYGTSFPLTKVIDDHIPLGPSLALRFGLATLVTLPWLWEVPALDWSTSRRAIIQGMGVGVWVSIGFLAQAIGIVTTQANKVRIHSNVHPIFTRWISYPISMF